MSKINVHQVDQAGRFWGKRTALGPEIVSSTLEAVEASKSDHRPTCSKSGLLSVKQFARTFRPCNFARLVYCASLVLFVDSARRCKNCYSSSRGALPDLKQESSSPSFEQLLQLIACIRIFTMTLDMAENYISSTFLLQGTTYKLCTYTGKGSKTPWQLYHLFHGPGNILWILVVSSGWGTKHHILCLQILSPSLLWSCHSVTLLFQPVRMSLTLQWNFLLYHCFTGLSY